MSRPAKSGLGVALALLAALILTPGLRGQKLAPAQRRDFMRQKLEFSKQILEGLTVENFESLSKNARALRKLSAAAEWEVPTIPSAQEYLVFTGEFQRLCDDLDAKAKEKNLDGATLAFLRITMSCVNCHKYVRIATPR